MSGDGRLDLVVAAAGSNQVFVYLQSALAGQSAADGFAQREPDFALDVGVSPSAVELADVDGDGRLDIVVTSQFSGDVSVFLQPRERSVLVRVALRARRPACTAWSSRTGRPVARSFAAPAGMAAGQFRRRTARSTWS